MDEELDLDAYMSQGGFGNAELGMEPGAMASSGMFGNDSERGREMQMAMQAVADADRNAAAAESVARERDIQMAMRAEMAQLQAELREQGEGDYQDKQQAQQQQQPRLDYQKGQYGINVPTQEAQLEGLGRRDSRGANNAPMPAFQTAELRNLSHQAAQPQRLQKDEHPISIITPTPAGLVAQRRRTQTPKNTYQGTILDGIGATQKSRSQKLTQTAEFAALTARDKELRDAVRAKQIEDNADGHYTKQKMAQQAVERGYRTESQLTGDSYDSYVDNLSRVEMRAKAKKDKQEEYSLLLREQQELKKLYDMESDNNMGVAMSPTAPQGSPRASGRSPHRGGVATIGTQSPIGPGSMGQDERERYRAAQQTYRQELDSQIERKEAIRAIEKQPAPHQRRPSRDADVQREMARQQQQQKGSRAEALDQISSAEINEFERKRYQQQKMLAASLENTSKHLDQHLLGDWNKHSRKEAEYTEREGDYFAGMGNYQSQLSDKEKRRAAAEKYTQQLAADKGMDTVTLPRRSLVEKKKDPYAPDETNVGVFYQANQSSQALPSVGRGGDQIGSLSSGGVGMAPGDMRQHRANKLASQNHYARQLEEDAKNGAKETPRQSLAAQHRANRLKEDAEWVAEMSEFQQARGDAQDRAADLKKQQQAMWARELANDQQVRNAVRAEGDAAATAAGGSYSPRSASFSRQQQQQQVRGEGLEDRQYAAAPSSPSPSRAQQQQQAQARAPQVHQQQQPPSRGDMEEMARWAQEEEDMEDAAAYELYVRQKAVEEAARRVMIQRQGDRDAMADALYADPLARN
jgi:hypothetical protein